MDIYRFASKAEADAAAARVNAALGPFPKQHTEDDVVRLGGGIHVPIEQIVTTAHCAPLRRTRPSDARPDAADEWIIVADDTIRDSGEEPAGGRESVGDGWLGGERDPGERDDEAPTGGGGR